MTRTYSESARVATYPETDRISGIIGIFVGVLTALAANFLLR